MKRIAFFLLAFLCFINLIVAIPQKENIIESQLNIDSSKPYLLIENTKKDLTFNNLQISISTKERGTPFIALCGFLITIGFSVMTYAVYLLRQVKFFASENKNEENIESTKQSQDRWTDRFINHVISSKPSDLIVLIPVIVLILFFLAFRAYTQNILETDTNYSNLQNGVVVLTVGMFLRILDILTITLHSQAFGNLSQKIGNLFLLIGFGFLFWGLLNLKSNYQNMNPDTKCFVALSFLVLISEIIMKIFIYYRKWKSDSPKEENEGNNIIDKLLNDQQIDEIANATSFASLLMICLFYLIFEHFNGPPITNTQKIASICCTVGVFVQVSLSGLKLIDSPFIMSISYGVKTITLVTIYSSFFVLIYSTINEGLKDKAVVYVYMLLFVIGSLMLIVTFGNEASVYLLTQSKKEEEEGEKKTDKEEEEKFDKFHNISKVLKDMSTTIEFAKIISIAFLYLHFRAEILIQKDFNALATEYSYLIVLMELSIAAIFVQMLGQIGEFFVGFNPFLSVVIGFCFLLCVVGLFGFVMASTSAY